MPQLHSEQQGMAERFIFVDKFVARMCGPLVTSNSFCTSQDTSLPAV